MSHSCGRLPLDLVSRLEVLIRAVGTDGAKDARGTREKERERGKRSNWLISGSCVPLCGLMSFFCLCLIGVRNAYLFHVYLQTYTMPYKYMSLLFKCFLCFQKSRANQDHEENCFSNLNVAEQLLSQADYKKRQRTSFMSASLRFSIFQHFVVVCLTEKGSWV